MAKGLVEFAQFAGQYRHRPAVADNVVQGQQQDMRLFTEDQQTPAKQRAVVGPLCRSKEAPASSSARLATCASGSVCVARSWICQEKPQSAAAISWSTSSLSATKVVRKDS